MTRLTYDELKQHQTSHNVFSTFMRMCLRSKVSRRVFDAQAIDVLRATFADVCSDTHATLVQMDAEGNHVHLLVEYPPKVAVSSLVNSLKGVCSRLLRQATPRHPQELLETRALVAQELRFLLQRSAQQHRAPIRAAEDPGLTLMTASLSALSFPALKDGACRAFWSIPLNRLIRLHRGVAAPGGRLYNARLSWCGVEQSGSSSGS
jgi:REP element-mobilizing transposase RayT